MIRQNKLSSLALSLVLSFSFATAQASPIKKADAAKSQSGRPEVVKKETAGKTAYFEISQGDYHGKFTVRLFSDRAPKTVENFIGLATGTKTWTNPKTKTEEKNKPLYNGTVFHRVIRDFMIQGGDPLGLGIGGPGYQFEDEVHATDSFDHDGILAMANSGPATNGSQFFITVKPTPWLNGKHTIFGEVAEGMDVIKKISETAVDPSSDRPVVEVKVDKITIH